MKKNISNGNVEAIVDTLGGELISYKNDGKEYIWTGEDQYWTGHAPILFPIVGALKDNKVLIDNKEYSMNKHGFARKSEFKLIECTNEKAIFELNYSDETLKIYPYKFTLIVTHEICECCFKTTYTVKNIDDKKISFAIGGHTGFLCPNIENYQLVFEKEENSSLYYTDSESLMSNDLIYSKKIENTNKFELDYNDYDVDVLILKDIQSRKVKLINKNTQKGVEYNFTGFDVLGIWTPPHKKAPFICLEPWNGIPAYDDESGKFEDKPYIVSVDVNKEYSVGYTVKILK